MRRVLAVLFIAISITVLLGTGMARPVSAISQDDLNSITNNTPFYDPNAAQQCSTTGATTTAAGTGAPNGTTFPNLDPTAMANAINAYIAQQNPQSELAGLGSTIVASAKNANITPFIIVAIAQKESSLASPSDTNVQNANNSFGRAAGPGQPSWQGARAWYKWSSVEASVDYTAPENQNAVGGGDEAAYIRNEYGAAIDSDNLLSFFQTYNPVSDGGDPSSYAALVQSIINTVAGASGGASSTSTPTASSGCGSSSSGSVNCSASSSASAATPGLSTVRQSVVCLAQQQLLLWEAQPGYPQPAYSESGYQVYSDDAVEEWCADFVSWIYNQAGYAFTGGYSGGWRISYVPNIQALGEQNQSFHWHPAGSGYTPQPGDLAIHGADHVNIFISSTGGVSTYIGGDQGSGPYPGGSIVSTETESGYYSGGITGYVSPD